jgi:benzodiazapine receptor
MTGLATPQPGRDRLASLMAWAGAAGVYGGAQAASSWLAFRARGTGTRPQYDRFEQPAFAPPGEVFPVVWSGLNLTTATSAWRLCRATAPGGSAGPGDQAASDRAASARRAALAWWALAVVARTGYVPLAFGGRRHLWAATGDAGMLCAIMIRYAVVARRADKTAAALAVPEIAWTAFATVLSTAVAKKNG